MKRIFMFGLLVGFAGTLAGAHLIPWVSYARLPSQTSVVANGGRAERFVIRLPADRIHAIGPAGSALRATALSADVAFRDPSASVPLLEHFKVRDTAGNVVGIAARHWLETADGPVSAWALSIPSRGTLVLSAAGEASGALEGALAARGYRAGAAWTGEVTVPMVRDSRATRSISGSREFAGFTVQYTETWSITGVSENGEVRGTIELDTLGQRG